MRDELQDEIGNCAIGDDTFNRLVDEAVDAGEPIVVAVGKEIVVLFPPEYRAVRIGAERRSALNALHC